MSPKLSRRQLMIGTSGLAAAGCLPRSASAADRPAHLTIANAAGGLNLTMAELLRQQRFLESFDLDASLVPVADGSKILGGIIGGSVGLSTMSGFGQIFPAIERGAPLRVLAGAALLPTLALFTGKGDVASLKDLEGRTVGTGSIGALLYQLTVTLLRKFAVDTSKVRFVNIGSSADVFRAVSQGSVDAGVGEVAVIDEAARYHVRPIPRGNMSVELTEYTYQGAWTSLSRIASERDVLVRSLAAYAKLYRFVQEPESKEAFLRASRTALPSASEQDRELQWTYIQTYKPFAVDLALSPERLRYMQDLNVEFNVQKQVLPFDRVADMSLAAEALKLLG